MMNKLKHLFDNKNRDILSIYFTAGFPELDATATIIKTLEKAQVDFVEAGMPFSDPLADGPTIQHSSEKALKNGMNLDIYFEQLQSLNGKIDIPVIAMGYVNQMMRYGEERFLKRCHEAGISGLILPDLPMNTFLKDYKSTFDKYNLVNIFLITPQTSQQRIREIDKNSDAFIYMVSSASTTGSTSGINRTQKEYFSRIKAMKLKNPLMIGFGISNRESYENACEYASGAIVGSAFIKAIDKNYSEKNILKFVNNLKG